MNKRIPLFLIFCLCFSINIVRAQEAPSLKAKIVVSPEIQRSFQKGGRLLLHVTNQREKEPRSKSEITFGVTPMNWNPSQTFVIDTKSKNVLNNGLEKIAGHNSEKYYCQVVYKQNIDDSNENVEGNLYSQVDSFNVSKEVKLNLTLQTIIPAATIVDHKFVKSVVIQSKCLSDFSGRPRFLKAAVLLPSGYFENPGKAYPICYRAPGLNGRYTAINGHIKDKVFTDWWFSKTAPQVIYVYLDSQGPYGDTYQVDSENNGPCGKALTEELIPEIEKLVKYKPETKKRYLTGMSTGGWVAFGLQVLYPDFFDGTWSYSPDPVDFGHYGLIDIYQDSTIFYNRYGYLQPGRRTIYDEPTFSMQDWIKGENVNSRTNDYRVSGGQFGAYNAVFGPIGKDGLPSLMFDPVTGKIDHTIAKQWEKYDLKKVMEKNWSVLGPKLQGKIWIWTGDMDGLYSNVATRFLKMYLDKTENPKSDAKISFTPMAGHCQEWSDTAVLMMVAEKAQEKNSLWLDDLKIQTFSDGIPSVNAKKSGGGDSICLAGQYFERGVGVHSLSALSFLLNGKAEQFSAIVGADDKANKNMHVQFFVIGDQKILFESGPMKVGDAPKKVNVNLSGIQRMGLLVTLNLKDEGYGKTYSDWADAKLVMSGEYLPKTTPNSDEKYILTPVPAKTPKINSAKIFGVTPGNPFLYTIASTGERPMQFSAENLPKGLKLDPKKGIITGKISQRGTYTATLHAKNVFGKVTKSLKIVAGDTIALTPPIGWNGWNSWAKNIDGEKVTASANAMVKMGLSNHGWTYINIDDTWEGQRGGKFNGLQANEKFPKFKEMIDNIHAMGLKLGVYSTPWISTYAGYAGASSDFEKGEYPDAIKNNKRAYRYVGKYRFEKEDALQMAEWGVDYLKYDWRIELNSAERMSVALKNSGRDILYSISNSAPFALGKEWARIANVWRTGPDIRDSWLSLYHCAFTIDKWASNGGPGHWNDPDMLILGNVTTGTDLHPTRLTPDEQYSHVALFSLLAAPLLIGCPIEQLDPFTLNLLTNDEVIEVNQDPLGKAARLMDEEKGVQIWLKPMEDGSYAVGLFNTADFGKTPQSYFNWGDEPVKQFTFDFSKIGLKGAWKLRDLWRQKDLGVFNGSFKTVVRHHGVVMLRMFPCQTE